MNQKVMAELRATFRPEFLNRVDETIVFHRLHEEHLFAITQTLLGQVKERFQALGITLLVPENTVHWLAKQGHDDKFGARPLRRTVQHCIEDAAAEQLLEGKFGPGDRVAAAVCGDRIRLYRV